MIWLKSQEIIVKIWRNYCEKLPQTNRDLSASATQALGLKTWPPYPSIYSKHSASSLISSVGASEWGFPRCTETSENLHNYQPQPHEKLGSLLSASVFILPYSFLNNKKISKCFEEGHITNKQEVQESYPSLSTYKALLGPLGTALEWAVLTEDQTK